MDIKWRNPGNNLPIKTDIEPYLLKKFSILIIVAGLIKKYFPSYEYNKNEITLDMAKTIEYYKIASN